MAVDTEVMVLALLVGGVLVMSMQNRQELPPERRRRSDIIAAADPEEMDLTDGDLRGLATLAGLGRRRGNDGQVHAQ